MLWFKNISSFRLKLITLFSVLVILSMGFVAISTSFVLHKILINYMYTYLNNQAKPVIEFYSIYSNDLAKEAKDMIDDITSENITAVVLSSNGSVLSVGSFEDSEKPIPINNYVLNLFLKKPMGTFEEDEEDYAYIVKKTKDVYFVVIGRLREINKVIKQFIYMLIVLTIGVVVFSVLTIYTILNKILKQLDDITRISENIYAGNMDIDIPDSSSSDEFGIMFRAFKKMVEKLNNTIKIQKNFIADVSHEFKTPISYIKAQIEFILTGVYQEDEMFDVLKKVYKQTDVLSKFTEDLLALARLESNIPISKTELDVVSLLNQLKEEFSIQNRNIILDIKSQDTWIADPHYLKIAVKNLLENAIKYSDKDIILGYTGDCICVKDFGPGIPEENLPYIFERFYRVSKDKRGLGLGLSIVKAVAQVHNFNLKVEVKDGTTFYICK
jgi:signal transduction histidine kinase